MAFCFLSLAENPKPRPPADPKTGSITSEISDLFYYTVFITSVCASQPEPKPYSITNWVMRLFLPVMLGSLSS